MTSTYYKRQRLTLQSPQDSALVLTQLNSSAELQCVGTMKMTLPKLHLVSGSQEVNDVAYSIINNSLLISNETAARTAADTALQSAVDQEVQDRQTAVTNEANARSLAVSTVQTNLNTESSARAAADTALQGAVTAEETARVNADTALQGAIDQEVQDRQNAILSESAARTSALLVESNARVGAVNNLTSSLATETAARLALESKHDTETQGLQSQIDNILNGSSINLDTFGELITAYENADTNLQGFINALWADVAELKGIVAALLANTEDINDD